MSDEKPRPSEPRVSEVDVVKARELCEKHFGCEVGAARGSQVHDLGLLALTCAGAIDEIERLRAETAALTKLVVDACSSLDLAEWHKAASRIRDRLADVEAARIRNAAGVKP